MEPRFDSTWVGALLAAALLVAPGPGAGADTMGARYEALMAVEDSTLGHLTSRERVAAITAAYDRSFGDVPTGALAGMATDELQAYFRAAEVAQFHGHRAQDLAAMERGLAELIRREKAEPADLRGLFGAYVATREFAKAEAFARSHAPELSDSLPVVATDLPDGFEGPTLLQVTDSPGEVKRLPFDPASDTYILAVSHPMCRFTRSVIAAIEADAELTRLFDGNAFWVAPADRQLHLDVLRAWN